PSPRLACPHRRKSNSISSWRPISGVVIVRSASNRLSAVLAPSTCQAGTLELLQQRLGLLQVERVEAFAEPAVDRREKIASCISLTLIAPELRHAHCGAEFPGFGLPRTRNGQRSPEICFRFRRVRCRRLQRDFAGHANDISLVPPFLGCFHRCHCF